MRYGIALLSLFEYSIRDQILYTEVIHDLPSGVVNHFSTLKITVNTRNMQLLCLRRWPGFVMRSWIALSLFEYPIREQMLYMEIIHDLPSGVVNHFSTLKITVNTHIMQHLCLGWSGFVMRSWIALLSLF